MKATLVIPSRGGATRLPVLLEALRRQTYADWEAIIVVDGDIDDSASVVARYRDLPVRTIVFPENRGRVAALNAGLEAALGDVLIRCDDDLEPAPDFVARHVAAHQGVPCGVVGLYKNILEDNPYAQVYGHDADERFRREAYAAPADQRWRYWAGNCSITRQTWLQVGPYDTRFRAYGWEDVDYGFRISKTGYPILLEPSLETAHHAAAVSTRSRARRAFLSGQARFLFDSIHSNSIRHTGPSRPRNTSPWNIATNLTALCTTYSSARSFGHIIDTLLPWVPPRVGGKLVALLVEASAVAGYSRPHGAKNDV